MLRPNLSDNRVGLKLNHLETLLGLIECLTQLVPLSIKKRALSFILKFNSSITQHPAFLFKSGSSGGGYFL